MSEPVSEEGFREIQLSGKQLVFLFMATTVVSVVIFLLGVLVGRDVRVETVVADATGATLEATPVDTPQLPADAGAAASELPAPVPEEPDEFSYHERLQQSGQAAEVVPPATGPEPAEAAPAPQPEAGSGWVAQIGAYNDAATADRIAATLKRSGFPAFVLAPAAGSPTKTYRVRVGPYGARTEAEAIAGRLQREHQFTPFVTR